MRIDRKLSRRALIGGMGAALLATRSPAMDQPELYGVGALLDGSGMVPIKAGNFWMGSEDGNSDEEPVHRVYLRKSFEMGKFEVTQSQWHTVMMDPHSEVGEARPTPQGNVVGSSPSHFKDSFLPVDSVSWDDIQVFLRRLNVRDPKHTYRLPTEAEWEYASRAGTTGDAPLTLPETAWFKGNSGKTTKPVGLKEPNAWGLYDMDGNVSEWVQDWYGYDYYSESPANDPTGPETGSYRIYRGGCWFDDTQYCRATLRRFDFPVSRFYNVGFRVVRTANAG